MVKSSRLQPITTYSNFQFQWQKSSLFSSYYSLNSNVIREPQELRVDSLATQQQKASQHLCLDLGDGTAGFSQPLTQ